VDETSAELLYRAMLPSLPQYMVSEFLTCTHTFTQPFYGPLSGTTRAGRYQKRHSPTYTRNVLWESVIVLDFMRRGEDNRGKCADNPTRRHPIRTIDAPISIIPPILRQMLLLPQPSQFILAWDRHQICLDCIPGGLISHIHYLYITSY